MNCGDLFRLRDDDVEGGHPWVVLTVPYGDANCVVIGNFTEHKPNKDQSCVILRAKEPLLRKDSIFSYRDARITTEAELLRLESAGHFQRQGRVQDETLDQIFSGAAVTRFIPTEVYEALDALGLIPFF